MSDPGNPLDFLFKGCGCLIVMAVAMLAIGMLLGRFCF